MKEDTIKNFHLRTGTVLKDQYGDKYIVACGRSPTCGQIGYSLINIHTGHWLYFLGLSGTELSKRGRKYCDEYGLQIIKE